MSHLHKVFVECNAQHANALLDHLMRTEAATCPMAELKNARNTKNIFYKQFMIMFAMLHYAPTFGVYLLSNDSEYVREYLPKFVRTHLDQFIFGYNWKGGHYDPRVACHDRYLVSWISNVKSGYLVM